MKLWLADFQQAGAIFIPQGIDHKEKRKLVICGKLQFIDGDIFYIKVRAHKGKPLFIAAVCSLNGFDGARKEFRRLMDKREEAIDNNTNNINSLIAKRGINVLLWWVFFLSFTILSGVAICFLIAKFSIGALGLLLICLSSLLLLFAMRNQLYCGGLFNAEVICDL